MEDFKESRRVPKKLLPHFPLSEEEPQRVPLQTPRETRPGNFKVATKTFDAPSPGTPAAAAAPVGLQSCRVDAVVQSCLVSTRLQRKAGGAVPSPSLSLCCPGDIQTVWERERLWCGSSTERGTAGPAVLLQGAGYPTSHHAQPSHPRTGQENHHPTATPLLQLPWTSAGPNVGRQPWLQEGFLPHALSAPETLCEPFSHCVYQQGLD